MPEAHLQSLQLRDRNGLRKYLTPEERARFRDCISGLRDPIKELYCYTIFCTGCRPTEAHRLRLESFDLAEGVLVIESLKKRRRGLYREIPVRLNWMKKAVNLLSKHHSGHGKKSIWGFSEKTGYRAVKRVMEITGIDGPHATPRGLRHAFGVFHAQHKTNPRLIQDWMGHASLETTLIYLDAQGKEAREAAKIAW
ncbi:MAG: site-specific integrase [Verrucomicrobiota bacterium]